jgi:hypothetical protein
MMDICSFHGLRHTTSHSSLNVYLRSNQLETIHPCTFKDFTRSTIHLENNPLICNCSFSYLVQNHQSLAYTGQECRGGFSYQPLNLPAVRKTNSTMIKKPINISITCRDSYRYYNDLCSKLDCISQCAPNERFIIQVTTISTPSRTKSIYQQTFLSIITVVLVQYNHFLFLV